MSLVACTGAAQPPPVTPEQAATPARAPLPRDIVARSKVGFHARTSTITVSGEAMTTWLAEHRVVCVGEEHTDPAHHYVQQEIIRRLASWARSHDAPLAVGFEMFERPQQPYLDKLSAGLDADSFAIESGYEERWGFDFSLYRPLLEVARDGGAKLLGLNAPRAWTRQVAKNGLEAVDPALRAQFPELLLDDAEHRAFFAAAMQGHPTHGTHSPAAHQPEKHQSGEHQSGEHQSGEHQSDVQPPAVAPELESYYVAQVIWDETMAESASRWLAAAAPNAHLVVVAGNGHCHESAIPKRIERRTGVRVLSSRPIAESELDESHVPTLDQFDALFVMAK